MENLLKCDGRRFRAKIDGQQCEGRIRIEGCLVYLCNNYKNKCLACYNKYGYKYAWLVGRSTDYLDAFEVTNFHLVPMTDAEIEAYKDFQVGDKVSDGDRVWEVIFRSGELVVCKNATVRATANHTCDELYGYGFRLVSNPAPEDDTVELTMDEIAEKVGIPVEKLRIKKEEAK